MNQIKKQLDAGTVKIILEVVKSICEVIANNIGDSDKGQASKHKEAA